MKTIGYVAGACMLLFTVACGSNKYTSLGAFSSGTNLNAVVEIPAGTNKKIEYKAVSSSFKVDQRNNKDRVIHYLPYVGNYGFIAGTKTKIEQDGDGDPVDVLILSEKERTGKVVAIKPIGILKLVDNGELDYKVIGLPVNTDKDVFNVTSYQELKTQYPGVISIIETWFKEYDNVDALDIVGWGDEKEALAYVNANLKQE